MRTREHTAPPQVMIVLKREFATPDEEMKKIVLKVVKQCVSTEGVESDYIKTEILPEFFKAFWVRRMALDRWVGAPARAPPAAAPFARFRPAARPLPMRSSCPLHASSTLNTAPLTSHSHQLISSAPGIRAPLFACLVWQQPASLMDLAHGPVRHIYCCSRVVNTGSYAPPSSCTLLLDMLGMGEGRGAHSGNRGTLLTLCPAGGH